MTSLTPTISGANIGVGVELQVKLEEMKKLTREEVVSSRKAFQSEAGSWVSWPAGVFCH